MDQALFDSEIKLMELIWEQEPISAKELSLIAAERIGWNKNTTYTVIKKLVQKGHIHRQDPGFICTALSSRQEVRRRAAQSLVDKLFDGSKQALFSALLEEESLSEEEIAELRHWIETR